MMKMIFSLKKTAVLLFALAVFLSACKKPETKPTTPSHKIKIAVSSYVPYTLAKSILGDMAEITLIIPPAIEPHAFEPTAQTILTLDKAQFFFYTSNTLEPWAQKLSTQGYALAQNLPDVLAKDPHVWMNFDNASIMAQNMGEYVSARYPNLEPQILKNYLNFNSEIQMLKRLYTKLLSTCETKTIYHIGHLAFGYIAQSYNLKFEALFSADMEQEPTAKEIAQIVKEIKGNNIKYIFSEEQISPALAQTIARETGAQILMLYTIEGITKEEFLEQTTYLQFMMKNLENLALGLNCTP